MEKDRRKWKEQGWEDPIVHTEKTQQDEPDMLIARQGGVERMGASTSTDG